MPIRDSLIILFFCFSCEKDSTNWPTAGWSKSTPAAQGLDEEKLSSLDKEFATGKHGYLDGMLVIRNGYIVYSKKYVQDYETPFKGTNTAPGQYNYYDPDWHPYYKGTELHSMQSISKSVTSAIVGIAIARGIIPDVNVKMSGYLVEFSTSDSNLQRQNMTLEDVLTMRTGIKWDESTVSYTDPANSCAGMEQSRDWVQFVMNQPMAAEPGDVFVYNSGATMLLSHMIRKTTGLEVDEYGQKYLFEPLGIKEYYWKRTPRGLTDTEGGLYLKPEDLAKIGYLFLKDGIWEGRRILPEGWVKESVTPRVELASSKTRYGYKWWLLPYKEGKYAITGLGYGGQRLIIIPDKELIAVFTGWNIYDTPSLNANYALNRLLKAFGPES